jgi:hypothetical protein
MADRAPTYWTTQDDDDTTVYHCAHCVHWATNLDLFKQHMEQQHDGVLIETPPKPPESEPTPPKPTPEPLPEPDPEEPVPGEAEGVE